MSDLIVPSRRGFLVGLGAFFVAAPAIVRAASIMPVRAIDDELVLLGLDAFAAALFSLDQETITALGMGYRRPPPLTLCFGRKTIGAPN